MGTRHLTCVLKNGAFRVAQYGQWDGYPTGQGQTIVKFLLNDFDPSKFREQIDRTRHVTSEEYQARWVEAGADPKSSFVSLAIAKKFKEKWPHLDRDFCAEILGYIQSAEEPEVSVDLDFARDSLFCEWAYVVNLDTDELEVYKKGFDPDDRLASEPSVFKFTDLTEDTMNQLEEAS